MSNGPIRPSTLDGIKRYSKTLKRTQGLLHARALDAAAVAAGYQNFPHAQNMLGAAAPAPPVHLAYISVMWRERETKAKGQEILTVRLSTPLNVLVKPAHLRAARHFSSFKMSAADHLDDDSVAISQSNARRRACAAARTLAFMEATGLRPSSGGSRSYPRGDYGNALPGHDHASSWYDPATKAYVYVDEPYKLALGHRVDERQAWSNKYGWAIVRPNWAGMYNPDGGCELYLVADKAKGFDLAAAVAALDAMPPPFVEADWDGLSQPALPPFVSPAGEAAASAPRLQSTPRVQRSPKATVGYRMVLMKTERRRPSTRMPVEGHKEVGRVLKSVIRDLPRRGRVFKLLDSVRCELDNWVQCEYNQSELDDQVFFDLYYRAHDLAPSQPDSAALVAGQVASLETAKTVLRRHYPDCAPVSSLLNNIDKAITTLRPG